VPPANPAPANPAELPKATTENAALVRHAAPLQPLPPLNGLDAKGNPKPLTQLNPHRNGQYCDLAVDGAGTFHAVFTDQVEFGKPYYVYYRSSPDGATWSEPKNLSDDESGVSAGLPVIAADGNGVLYAIWKYDAAGTFLDGPGGYANGTLAYRCLNGGAWSRIIKVTDPKIPAYSWFAAQGAHGELHLIWSQMAADAVQAMIGGSVDYADLVVDAELRGPTVGAERAVIAPVPLPTPEQQEAMKRAGHYPSFAETHPKQEGFMNLRGFLDDRNRVHFVAECPGIADGPQKCGRRLMSFDGERLTQLYAFDLYQTYNNFNNPAQLLVDAQGRPHVFRAPEKSEVACVRDYPLEDGQLGDAVNVIEPLHGKGYILNWQAVNLPGGRMCVTAAMSDQPAVAASEGELYVSFSDGGGKWTAPLCITDNARRATSQNRVIGAGGVAVIKTYLPQFATVATGRDGHPCVLMVDNESTLSGVIHPLATYSARTSAPLVLFVKL
jgi:hypothetical protein